MENKSISKANIMIIDNDVNMMEILTAVLNKYGHNVKTYTEPVAAIEELKKTNYDILLVNYLMTPVNGDKIIKLVREFDKEIYIILMSMHKDLAPSIETMQNLDIQSYFEKSSRFDQLIMFIQTGIKYIEQLRNVKKMNLKLEMYLVDFVKILINTVDAKDHYTAEHSLRVSKICEEFGNFLGMSEKDIETLTTAANFHDVGKIGIPDSILLKEGKLTNEEYETIKSHPVIGANIFRTTAIFNSVPPIIECHHERVDGKGYPFGLKGDKIPYLARVLTICDSFDAITSKRPYKKIETVDFALEQIKKGFNNQFDKDLSIKFIEFINTNQTTIKSILS
ncbi:MAG: HD domain-containing protein [Clostridia bacterium]